jgi:hypothetical protein
MTTSQAQSISVDNPFARSRELFEKTCERLRQPEAFAMQHTDVERLLATEGRAILQQLFQDHLDLRGLHEQAVPHLAVVGEDGVVRPHHRDASRELRTLVGDVVVPRIGYSQRGATSLFPMDAALNLPADGFSLGVRHTVAMAAASNSFEESVTSIEAMTGTHVGKRQAEQLARAAAVDFEEFYDERAAPVPASPPASPASPPAPASPASPASLAPPAPLLVMSSDQKGIVVRLEDLRPATRKARLAKTRRLKTRLTKGEKKYAKRMAMVTTVYTVVPHVRSADDILADLLHETPPEKRRRPHAEQKRIWATIEKESDQAIARLFDEAEKRDPQHRLHWVVVVDGNKDQLALIETEAARRGIAVTIVLDFIHVLQYLWAASTAFHEETAPEREQWVLSRLREVLCGHAVDVAAGMRRSATLRDLPAKTRAPVDECADYLLGYKAYLHYEDYLRDGLPIASGVIEGGCRHLVNDRLGVTGAHWSLAGAEAILRLRALRSSGDLATYWAFHERREYERNHADRYQGAVPRPHSPKSRPVLRLVN